MPNKCDKNFGVNYVQAQPYHTPPYFDWRLMVLWHGTVKTTEEAFGNIVKTVFNT